MHFERVSERNTWAAVDTLTRRMQQRPPDYRPLLEWLQSRGVDVDRCVFSALARFDEDSFSGTLVNQHRRVLEFFVDASAPDSDDNALDDVTDLLGPKDPSHPRRDLRDSITMGLVYFDHYHPGLV